MLNRNESARGPRFLILGNGRSGSTWLLTSLDLLPDVNARQEIKWLDGVSEFRNDAQTVIDRSSSMIEAIEKNAFDPNMPAQVRGSKMIFNPYCFHGPQMFVNLASVIEPDIDLILLKRSYLEMWLSWKARGVYHQVDEGADPHSPRSHAMLDAMRQMKDPGTASLVLHHAGKSLAEAAGIAYPLETAVDDLLQMYVNDLQLIPVVKGRDGLIVDYAEIPSRLSEVASFIGADVDDQRIHGILAKPQTRKLPSLDHLLSPFDVLAEIAGALDETFHSVARGASNPQLAWSWIDAESASIMAPLVVSVLTRFGFEPHGHEIRWKIRKPYVNI
jgi:hypothetical protein